MPPIITVAEPFTTVSGGPVQVHMSPTRNAGTPPIITVAPPGGNAGASHVGHGSRYHGANVHIANSCC